MLVERPLSVIQVVGNVAVGGAEHHVLDLVDDLRSLGAGVRVVCPRPGPLSASLIRRGAAVAFIEMVRPLPGDDYALDFDVVEHLASSFRQWRPDVVHSHLYPAHLHASLAAMRAGVPAIVQTAHTLIIRPFDIVLDRLTNAFTIATSRAVADGLIRARMSPDRIHVIYNGIDCQPYSVGDATAAKTLRPDLALRGGPVVGTVVRLSHEKGVDVLLTAFRDVVERVPSATLLIVGDGPERNALGDLSERLGIARRVHFAGARSDVPVLDRILDVFVLPSREEACPLALLEAMAAGRAVVATCVGGSPELVEDGVDGVLVPVENADALAAAITALIDDPARRDALGRNARAKIGRQFTRERMVRETHALYLHALAAWSTP